VRRFGFGITVKCRKYSKNSSDKGYNFYPLTYYYDAYEIYEDSDYYFDPDNYIEEYHENSKAIDNMNIIDDPKGYDDDYDYAEYIKDNDNNMNTDIFADISDDVRKNIYRL
jgi:hypothetical protein